MVISFASLSLSPLHPVTHLQWCAAYFTTLPLIIIVMNSLALRRASSTVRALLALRRPAHRALSTQKDPQLGDYPALPDVSRATLPPTGWWDNQMRRNFGETVCHCLNSILDIILTSYALRYMRRMKFTPCGDQTRLGCLRSA